MSDIEYCTHTCKGCKISFMHKCNRDVLYPPTSKYCPECKKQIKEAKKLAKAIGRTNAISL